MTDIWGVAELVMLAIQTALVTMSYLYIVERWLE